MVELERHFLGGDVEQSPALGRGKCGRAAFGGKIVVDVFRLKKMEKLWGKRRVVFGAKWLGEMFII